MANFGRIRVQDWIAPKGVRLYSLAEEPRSVVSERNVKGEPAECQSPSDIGMLEFVIHPPWAMYAPAGKRVRPSREIFERFVALGSASDEKIRVFAERYGPLLVFWQKTRGKKDLVITERCDVWRYFARTMEALLHIGAGFRTTDRQGRNLDTDWNVILDMPPIVRRAFELEDQDYVNQDYSKRILYDPEYEWSGRARVPRNPKHRHKATWMMLMNCLLQLGRTRPWLLSDQGQSAFQIVFSGPNLLSYLALQICMVVATHDSEVMCSNCKGLYRPKRSPKAGQRNFCPKCRDEGWPVRLAQRDRLARLKSETA